MKNLMVRTHTFTMLTSRLVVMVLFAALLSAAPFHAKLAQNVFTGTVDKVTPADPAKATKPEIVVVGQENKSMTFVITDTCTLNDAKGGTITLDKITKGLGVGVTYTTNAQGVNEAASIKLLK